MTAYSDSASSGYAAGIYGYASAALSPGLGAVGVGGYALSPNNIGVLAANLSPLPLTSFRGWALLANNYAGGPYGWVQYSDGRLKKDIKTIPAALGIIQSLHGVNYFFDHEKYPDLTLPNGQQYGFVAQELEKILPNEVREAYVVGNTPPGKDSKSAPGKSYLVKTVSYTNIIPILVEAMKEQQKQIEDLKKQLDQMNKK